MTGMLLFAEVAIVTPGKAATLSLEAWTTSPYCWRRLCAAAEEAAKPSRRAPRRGFRTEGVMEFWS
jgi:hypothetical protein